MLFLTYTHTHTLLYTHIYTQGIQSRLLDTKAVGEVQAMGDFFAMLSAQPDRAQYGFNHVKVWAVGFLPPLPYLGLSSPVQPSPVQQKRLTD